MSIYLLFSAVAAPVMTVVSTTPTTIHLSWTSSGPDVDRYDITWRRDTSGRCKYIDRGSTVITNGSISYNIRGLEEHSRYLVTVKANNAAGGAVSNSITGVTLEAGEGPSNII